MIFRQPKKFYFVLILFFVSIVMLPVLAQGYPSTFVAWKPDGTMLAISSGTTVQIVDAATMQTLNAFAGLQEQVTAPAWSPDGSKLAIANGAEVQIWQQPWSGSAAQLLATYPSASYIRSLAWSPSGDWLAVAQDAVELWNVATGQLLYSKEEHRDSIFQIAWSPDGTQLATASVDKTVKIWDATTGVVQSTMRVGTNSDALPISEAFVSTSSVSWSPDGTQLVFGAEDGTIRFWDRNILSGEVVATGWGDPAVVSAHSDPVWAIAWSPTGEQIASGGLDGTVRIWDTTTRAELQVIQVGAPVGSVVWSPDGTQIAYGGDEGKVEIVSAPGEDVFPAADGGLD